MSKRRPDALLAKIINKEFPPWVSGLGADIYNEQLRFISSSSKLSNAINVSKRV